MKRFMLIAIFGLCALSADVGKASNTATKEKQLVLLVDPGPASIEELCFFLANNLHSDLVILVQPEGATPGFSITKPVPLDFILPYPLVMPELIPEYLPYKPNGQLKNKFHPRYLFNPVKIC